MTPKKDGGNENFPHSPSCLIDLGSELPLPRLHPFLMLPIYRVYGAYHRTDAAYHQKAGSPSLVSSLRYQLVCNGFHVELVDTPTPARRRTFLQIMELPVSSFRSFSFAFVLVCYSARRPPCLPAFSLSLSLSPPSFFSPLSSHHSVNLPSC